jgi:hypothetical protein
VDFDSKLSRLDCDIHLRRAGFADIRGGGLAGVYICGYGVGHQDQLNGTLT